MEKLKTIIWERIGHASVCWNEKGVFDEVEANKAANAIWEVVEPLLEADRIVRRLAEYNKNTFGVDNSLAYSNISEDAKSYTTNNPKEGGEGE